MYCPLCREELIKKGGLIPLDDKYFFRPSFEIPKRLAGTNLRIGAGTLQTSLKDPQSQDTRDCRRSKATSQGDHQTNYPFAKAVQE